MRSRLVAAPPSFLEASVSQRGSLFGHEEFQLPRNEVKLDEVESNIFGDTIRPFEVVWLARPCGGF